MKLKLHIDDINYESIMEQAIPILKEKVKNDNNVLLKTLSGILSMPGNIRCKMLNALPQDVKDELVVYFINSNEEKIIAWIQSALVNRGLDLEIVAIDVEK